jgi:serine/threonine-protein kinase
MKQADPPPATRSLDARTLPTAEDLSGKTLGDYLILRRLGQGGMGQVYLAEQRSLKRRVALKILKSELAASPTSLKRFQLEAEAAARITHANIVQVYAFGATERRHFIALEYVDGCTLRDYVLRKGPPPLALALSIMRQAAAALQRASEHGVIHRDVKPENVLLTRKGEVKVADFGLSRCLTEDQQPLHLTQSGVTLGTPLYMSPEQVEGRPLDPRTDIYSLGATFYFMFTGRPPFQGRSAFEVAVQHVQAEPEPLRQLRPDVPEPLNRIIRKMMAKRPEHRYVNGRELLRDLTQFREELAASLKAAGGSMGLSSLAISQISSPSTTLARMSPRRKVGTVWLAVLGAVTVVMAAVGGGLLGWASRSAPTTPSPPPRLPATIKALRDTAELRTADEQLLQKMIKQYRTPQDETQLNLGLGHCMELSLIYLDQWRLDEADEFFTQELMNSVSKAYATFGSLGHAIVGAFRDHAQESNRVFLDVFTSNDPGALKTRTWINRNPSFLSYIARALDYNAANNAAANQPFPGILQDLRKPQPFPLPRGEERSASQ